jgi:hypothetical protein
MHNAMDVYVEKKIMEKRMFWFLYLGLFFFYAELIVW